MDPYGCFKMRTLSMMFHGKNISTILFDMLQKEYFSVVP
jgi:hypothetical protein